MWIESGSSESGSGEPFTHFCTSTGLSGQAHRSHIPSPYNLQRRGRTRLLCWRTRSSNRIASLCFVLAAVSVVGCLGRVSSGAQCARVRIAQIVSRLTQQCVDASRMTRTASVANTGKGNISYSKTTHTTTASFIKLCVSLTLVAQAPKRSASA